MTSIVELEQEDIELQLMEIGLKRKLNEIKRKRLEKNLNTRKSIMDHAKPIPRKQTVLYYNQSAVNKAMRIADVNEDGCILIYGKKESKIIAKKYNMRTLYWIKEKLPTFERRQKIERNFWGNLADHYSKKFLDKNDSLSKVTMEKLCYLVDSGKADVWFEKWFELKKDKQSTLDGR